MKITIEKTEKVVTELEVQLPYYSRYNELFYYKVISEKQMIKVTNGMDYNYTIELTEYLISSAFRQDTVQIDSSEFRQALIKATQIIVNS